MILSKDCKSQLKRKNGKPEERRNKNARKKDNN